MTAPGAPQGAGSERDLLVPIASPLGFDGRGRTAAAPAVRHIEDLIESVLFTAPGERVMRPTFGSGLLQLVFAPNSDHLAATLQVLVAGALQQWLGDLIDVNDVRTNNDDATLEVSVDYTIRSTGETTTATFTQP
jgi:phage baseplate assembly protein W